MALQTMNMNMNQSMSNASTLVEILAHPGHLIPGPVQAGILLFIAPPAVICNLFLLYHLITDRHLRKQLHNHIIVAILFASLEFNVIHVPFAINLFLTGSVWPRSVIACSIWRFTAYTGCNANDVLLAWAAIERHILIYHSQMIRQYWYRLFFHYVPLVCLVVYLFFFNAASFFTPACFTQYDFSAVFCDATCLGSVVFMSTWYLVANQLLAAVLAIIFSFALFMRVIQRRMALNKSIDWQRLNKLTAQVLILTILFIVLEVPYAITGSLDYFGLFKGSPTFNMINAISLFLCYIMPIIMPFACFLGLYSELRGKFRLKKNFSLNLQRSYAWIGQLHTRLYILATVISGCSEQNKAIHRPDNMMHFGSSENTENYDPAAGANAWNDRASFELRRRRMQATINGLQAENRDLRQENRVLRQQVEGNKLRILQLEQLQVGRGQPGAANQRVGRRGGRGRGGSGRGGGGGPGVIFM